MCCLVLVMLVVLFLAAMDGTQQDAVTRVSERRRLLQCRLHR